MTLQRWAYVGGSVLFVLFATTVLFLGNQHMAEAQVVPDAPEIVCAIYDEFNNLSGSPFFDENCGNDEGEEEVPPADLPACFDTNDNDGDDQTDFPNDPGCDGYFDDDETDPTPPVVDVCPNLEGDQTEVPEGYELENDQCVPVPTDVCPNIDGVQETVPEGMEVSEGNCVDTPEPPASGGGGGGGGGGGSSIVGGGSSGGGGQVLGASIVPTGIACDKYLTSFIKPEADNDTEQVYRLQALLKTFEGAPVEVNGVYDEASVAAVHAFQAKYAEEILAPWGITEPTGFVYLTTRKKVNEIYCDRGLTFPLSEEEQQVIEAAKTHVDVEEVNEEPLHEEEESVVDIDEEEEEAPAPVVNTPSRSIFDFVRGIFDWLR